MTKPASPPMSEERLREVYASIQSGSSPGNRPTQFQVSVAALIERVWVAERALSLANAAYANLLPPGPGGQDDAHWLAMARAQLVAEGKIRA